MRAGDASAALEALEKLQERLDSELGILVSAETWRWSASFAARPGRPPRPACTLIAAQAPLSTRSSAAGGLVGREQDFADLVKAWRAARSGSGGAVLLEGEGGIGKTRLVEELQATARRADANVLIAGTTAAGPGRASPFAIWTDAPERLVRMTGHPPEAQAWTADLARIVPALAGKGRYRAGNASQR